MILNNRLNLGELHNHYCPSLTASDFATLKGCHKILAVNCSPRVRCWLRRMAAPHDMVVCVAGSLEEACGWLAVSLDYAAVVCDEDLPNASGWDLLAWLRHDRESSLPFLLLCAAPPPFDPTPRLKLMAKPVDPVVLREALHQLLVLHLRQYA